MLEEEEVNFIEKIRLSLSHNIVSSCNHTVMYGPFKGMKLLESQYWGQADLPSKLLGFYEQEVVEKILQIQEKTPKVGLINLGGADGYYSIGSVFSGLFQHAYVFETSQRGRDNINTAAKLNNVEKNVTVLGEATTTSFQELLHKLPCHVSNTLILVDIEGDEYKIFTPEMINCLKESTLIIEAHIETNNDQPTQSLLKEKAHLFELLKQHFNVEIFRTKGRDLSQIAMLKSLSDNIRSLLISEGRTSLGEWWYLSPLK